MLRYYRLTLSLNFATILEHFNYFGPLAQSAEQGPLKPKVAGSIPARPRLYLSPEVMGRWRNWQTRRT